MTDTLTCTSHHCQPKISLKVFPVSPRAPAGLIFPDFSHLPNFSISKLTLSAQPAVLQRITNHSLTYGGSSRYCSCYFTQGEGRNKQRGKFLKLLNDCETEGIVFSRAEVNLACPSVTSHSETPSIHFRQGSQRHTGT